MKLIECLIDGYKNLKNVEIYPCNGINVVYGANAQGKTNLIEAIGLFSGRERFHGKDANNIAFDREFCKLQIKFNDMKRDQIAEATLSKKSKFFLNRVPLKRLSEFCGCFNTVSFAPAHISIVQNDPKTRRKFIDDAITQIRPEYAKYCRQYERILSQRNILLKNNNHVSNATIEIWNVQMAKIGTIITMMRQDYIDKVSQILEEIYSGISMGKESLKIYYMSTVFDRKLQNIYSEDDAKEYMKKLEESEKSDFEMGFTKIGVHRDDFILKIDGLNVREYGSQGQQRSCIIALKLAEAKLLKLIKGTNPIVLLDDVMSELDVDRQSYILNHVKGNQVFITCCDISNTISLKDGKIYHVQNGEIELMTK